MTLAGTDAANYVVVQPKATANITQATLTVTGITATNKVYDGTTNATIDTTNIALVGVIAGDTVGVDPSAVAGTFDTKDFGVGKLVTISGLTLTGAAAGNYMLVQPTVHATISARVVVVTGITASDKVYDGSDDATIDTTNAQPVGFLAGDDVTLNLSAATGSFVTKDVGLGNLVTVSGLYLTGADAIDYVIIPPGATADVTPATLTVDGHHGPGQSIRRHHSGGSRHDQRGARRRFRSRLCDARRLKCGRYFRKLGQGRRQDGVHHRAHHHRDRCGRLHPHPAHDNRQHHLSLMRPPASEPPHANHATMVPARSLADFSARGGLLSFRTRLSADRTVTHGLSGPFQWPVVICRFPVVICGFKATIKEYATQSRP